MLAEDGAMSALLKGCNVDPAIIQPAIDMLSSSSNGAVDAMKFLKEVCTELWLMC